MKKKITRLFFIAFSILLLFESMRKVSAATTDDLRVAIGERRVTDETLISDVKAMIYKYRQSQYRNELIGLLKENGDQEYENTFKKLMKEKEQRQASLEECFSANKPVKEVITKLNEVYSVLSELGALRQPNTYILDEFGEGDQEIAYEYAESVLSSMEDDFDIGVVGEGLRPPTLNNFHLVKAFGKYMDVLENAVYRENEGIDLQVSLDNFQIVSQFNGTVKEVKQDGKNYSITITHGAALQTVYSYLKDVRIKEGQKVKQYEVIGYAASDTIHFKIVLNTVPINPLFIYGGLGERAYMQWMAENPGMVIEATDFTGVKKYFDDITEPVETTVPSTVTDGGVETELEFEDDYVKPEVPVVNNDG